MFLLAVFLLLIFSVFWRIIITNFFHCLHLYMVRNYVKNPKIRYDNEKCNMIYSVNNGASIQVQLGLSIVEIYVDQHSKS